MTETNIETKIRKLLRLAQNNPSVEEAAVAFATAQRLATLHALDLDDLGSGEEPEPPKEIEKIRTEILDIWKKRTEWKLVLAGGISRANGCLVYYTRSGIVIYGQPSDIATARYVYLAIVREVDALARSAVKAYVSDEERDGWETPRQYGNAWRLGCAHAIRQRMPTRAEEVKATKGAIEGERTAAAIGGESLAPSTTALVRVCRAEEYVAEVDRRVEDFKRGLGLGKRKPAGRVSSASGYEAGRKTGAGMNLGGGRRAIGGAS